MNPEDFGKAAALCAPESLARQAISRLDRYFGTRTELVEDVSLLPEDIRQKMAEFGYRKENAKGIFDTRDNRVYLIATRLDSATDAVMTYRHEVTGHRGVRATLGADRDQTFQEIYHSFESDPRVQQIAERYQLDLSFNENQMLVAEELVAMIAENGEQPSLYDKIHLAAKQQYSSQTGAGIVYTDEDIRVLLQRGREFLRAQASFSPTASPGLRGPSALEPRQSKLSSLLKSLPDESWVEFDQHLMGRGEAQIEKLVENYATAEKLTEAFDKYLVANGVQIERDGSVRVTALTEFGASLLAGQTVIANIDGVDTATTYENLAERDGLSVISPALARTAAVYSNPLRFMYLGEQASERLGRTETFEKATQLKMEGRTSSEIWAATGWFEGPDGAWRFEISDRDATTNLQAMEETAWLQQELNNISRQLADGLIGSAEAARKTSYYMERIDQIGSHFDLAEPGTLPAFLNHPTLFEAYPELRSMRVIVDPTAPYPEVTTNTPRIIIPESYLEDADLLRETLIHETQHLVQRLEGFAKGLSPFMNGEREAWESELNQLLESDPDVQIYMELHAELFDGRTGVNPELTKQEMKVLEEDSPSIQRMNELAERLRLIADPEAYTKAFGEIEAHESAARAAMTEGQRRSIAPYGTDPKPNEFVVHQFEDVPQAMFVGARARTANPGRLSQAHDLELAGIDRETILDQTGWFRGVDGFWRFEIDDSQTSLNPDALSILKPAWNALEAPRIDRVVHRKNPNGGFDVQMIPVDATRVSDIIQLEGVSRSFLMMNLPVPVASSIMEGSGKLDYFDFETDEPNGRQLDTDFTYDQHNFLPLDRLINHPELFKAYPELKEWNVAFHPKSEDFPNSSAFCDSQRQTIVLFPQSVRQLIPTLLHETQHAIQSIEGFALGTSPGAPSVAAKVENPGKQYHSAVLHAVQSAPFEKAAPDQWMGYLKKQPGVKQAELDWLNLGEWLEDADLDGPVSQADLADQIAKSGLSPREVFIDSQGLTAARTLRKELGDWCESFAKEASEHGFGFEEPLELIHEARSRAGWCYSTHLEIPPLSEYEGLGEIFDALKRHKYEDFLEIVKKVDDLESSAELAAPGTSPQYEDYILSGGSEYREFLMLADDQSTAMKQGEDFVSEHWPGQRNVMAHARFQTINEAGQKTLLIEEIQSDWRTRVQQMGDASDPDGAMAAYGDLAAKLNEVAARLGDAEKALEQSQRRISELGQNENVKHLHEGDLSYSDLTPDDQYLADSYDAEVHRSLGLVTDIELLKAEYEDVDQARSRALMNASDTPKAFPLGKDWYATVAKRLIRYAAENGFDSVAWSPSAVQAERYAGGERQRYDEVEWHPAHDDDKIVVTAERGDEHVISDAFTVAEIKKLFDSKTAKAILSEESGSMFSPSITTDAKGFETFYDNMLPKALNKALKSYGQQVEWRSINADLDTPSDQKFPSVAITNELRADLRGSTTPMYKQQTADALSTYYRTAGEVEARAVESTYRNPELKSVHPMSRYDVAPEEQIVSRAGTVTMKIGPNAQGINLASLETAAKLVSQKALGVSEAYPKVLNALAGHDYSATGGALRQRFGRLAGQINEELKSKTGWVLDDTGHLRFELSVPDLRAKQTLGQFIARDVQKLAEGVRSGQVDVTRVTSIYNQITRQDVPLKALLGNHEVFVAYPELEDVMVTQSPDRPETRFDKSAGAITVPPNLSSMELGAYLTKGVNQAINTFERIGDPTIQRTLYSSAPAQRNRARVIESIVNQCEGLDAVPREVVEKNLGMLEPADAEFLSGLPLERAAKFAHAATLNLEGNWSSSKQAHQPKTKPEAANEQKMENVDRNHQLKAQVRNLAM
ncbi:LPD23 domain-containing protein [Marinobacter sp.]|uniref:LPD23 domain-containing protein n=1 Tax=Marinobacter sp. TaxID=50741 RepID=UPI00356751EF